MTGEQEKQKKFKLQPICVLAIIVFAVLLALPFLLSKNVYGHDIKYHYDVIRALNQSFKEGNFFSRILGFIGQNYGYGTGLCYSLLPAGIAVLFMNLFGASVSTAVGLELILLFVATGIVMFYFAKRITKNNLWALFVSALYLIMPYTLNDVYERFAFSEMFLMLALPLIFWGAYELLKRKNIRAFFLLFTLGYALAFMTHLTMAVYSTLFVFIYLMCYIKDIFKNKLYIPLIIACVMAVLMSAIYWLPMLVNKGDVQIGAMNYGTNFLSLNSFYNCFRPWVITSVVIGIIVIVGLSKHMLANRGNNSKDVKILFSLIVISFGMAVGVFPWFLLPDQFALIQYGFRMFLVNTLLVTFGVWYLLSHGGEKKKYVMLSAVLLLCLFGFAINMNHGPLANGKGKSIINKASFDEYGISENLGLGASKKGDYYPLGATKDYVFHRANEKMVVSSTVKITEFANYPQINQLSFLIGKQRGGECVLNLPYELFEDVEIFQITEDKYALKLGVTWEECDGLTKLKFEESLSECKITIRYSNNSKMKQYLSNNPFEFIVKSGVAELSAYERTAADKYTVDVEIVEKSKIELPTFYYKGYVLTLETESGTKEIEPIFGENGFVEVELTESGTLHVEFKPTYVKKANIISIAGAGIFLCLTIVAFAIPKKYTILSNNGEI